MKRLLITSLAFTALVLAITRERPGRLSNAIAAADFDGEVNTIDLSNDAKPGAAPASSAAMVTAVGRVVASVPNAASPFALAAATGLRLGEYRAIERKVFLTANEKSARAAMVRDAAFLTEVGRLVSVRAKPNPTELRDQDAALALLLEARAVGTPAAIALLTAVVTDGAVEDQTVDRGVREHLAGVKAEVLYEWSATDPARAAQLAEALPGPVSRQLWENVRGRQRSNLAESAAESMAAVH